MLAAFQGLNPCFSGTYSRRQIKIKHYVGQKES